MGCKRFSGSNASELIFLSKLADSGGSSSCPKKPRVEADNDIYIRDAVVELHAEVKDDCLEIVAVATVSEW